MTKSIGLEYTYEQGKFFIYASSLFKALMIKDMDEEQWLLNIANDKYHQDDIINEDNILLVTIPYAKELSALSNTEFTIQVKDNLLAISNLNPADDAAENVILEEYKVKRRVMNELFGFITPNGLNITHTERFIHVLVRRIIAIKDNTRLRFTLLREVDIALREFRDQYFTRQCPVNFVRLLETVHDEYINLSNSARGGQRNKLNYLEKENKRLQEENKQLQEQLAAKQESPVQMDENTIKALKDFLDKISE